MKEELIGDPRIKVGSRVILQKHRHFRGYGRNWKEWEESCVGNEVEVKAIRRAHDSSLRYLVVDAYDLVDDDTRECAGKKLTELWWRARDVTLVEEHECLGAWDAKSFDCQHCFRAKRCNYKTKTLAVLKRELPLEHMRPEVRSHLIARSYPIGGIPESKPCDAAIVEIEKVFKTSSDHKQWSETVDAQIAENNRVHYGTAAGVEARRKELEEELEEIERQERIKHPEPNPIQRLQDWLMKPMGNR